MVRYSPSQVVPNTPGVWLAFIASNLWSEDYQDFYADHDDVDDDDDYVVDEKIKEIRSRCRTCFSKFDDPVTPHLGPWSSDRFCVEYIWTIIGSAEIINNPDNINHIKMLIIAAWMNIEPDVLGEFESQLLTAKKQWFLIFLRNTKHLEYLA